MLRLDGPLTPDAAVILHATIASFSGRVTIFAEPRVVITPARILAWVSAHTRYDAADIERGPGKGLGNGRPSLRRARAAAAWAMRVLLDTEVEAIGQWFGGAGFGYGNGLLAYAERERGRNAGYRVMTDAMIQELMS